MSKFKLIWVMLAFAHVVTSCSNDAEDIKPAQQSQAVTLSLTPDVKSRVTTEGSTTKFAEGDVITITSTGLVANMSGAKFTVGDDGKSLSCADQYFYDGNNTANFYAYYPESATGDATSASFTVATDQSAENAYADNDFMTAKCSGNPSATAVLTFTHQLAWAKVKIDALSDASITMSGVKTKTTYSYSDDTATTDSETSANVTMGLDNGEFRALIPAQSFAANVAMLTITAGEDTYTYTPTAEIAFDAGKIKTISLTIANGVVIEAGISVDDWAEDSEVPGHIFKQ